MARHKKIATVSALLALLTVASCSPAPEIQFVDWDDGDSGTLVQPGGWKLDFRLKYMDAPETDGRRFRCPEEEERGKSAAALARQLTSRGVITITRRYGTDSTGRRELVDLAVDGQGVREALIDSGLAQAWDYDSGEPKPDWCEKMG